MLKALSWFIRFTIHLKMKLLINYSILIWQLKCVMSHCLLNTMLEHDLLCPTAKHRDPQRSASGQRIWKLSASASLNQQATSSLSPFISSRFEIVLLLLLLLFLLFLLVRHLRREGGGLPPTIPLTRCSSLRKQCSSLCKVLGKHSSCQIRKYRFSVWGSFLQLSVECAAQSRRRSPWMMRFPEPAHSEGEINWRLFDIN